MSRAQEIGQYAREHPGEKKALNPKMQTQADIDNAKLVFSDRDGQPTNLQLFCDSCGKGAGDEADRATGFLKRCPWCKSFGPFVYSWEVSDG